MEIVVLSLQNLWRHRRRQPPAPAAVERPRGLPAPTDLIDRTLLQPDQLCCLLDSLHLSDGLRIGRFARVCRAWRDAVAARVHAGRVLSREHSFPTRSFGDRVVGNAGRAPFALALLPRDELCVATTCAASRFTGVKDDLLVYSRRGEAMRTVSRTGRCPRGLACAGDSIFVSDAPTHVVQKLHVDGGVPLDSVGGDEGDGKAHFRFPTGLCCAGDNLYVCDQGNQRVCALNMQLRWCYKVACKCPVAVAAHSHPTGFQLYVADWSDECVRVFTACAPADGALRFRRAIGRRGDAPGQFREPRGVCVVRGALVVSEEAGERVQCLTLEGVPLQVITFASRLMGLCADHDRVWVADETECKVHVLGAVFP